jgi:hypothetical protein
MKWLYWLTYALVFIPFVSFGVHIYIRTCCQCCERCKEKCKECKERKNMVGTQMQNPARPVTLNQPRARSTKYPLYGQRLPFGYVLAPLNYTHPQYIPNTFTLPSIQPQSMLNNANTSTVAPMNLQTSHHVLNTEPTNVTNNVV